MLRVYSVGVPTERFQFFETDSAEIFDSVMPKMHGESVRKKWKPPSVYIHNPKKPQGHFIGFLGGRVFAVAQETIDAFPMLTSFFEQSGEQLPFTHEGREFVVFNCTNCINAIDKKKSKESGFVSMLAKYVFVPTRFHFTLFTIPETIELLCVEGMSASHDEFKGYVEENKLTGLMFEELWSEKASPPRKKKK